MRKITTADRLRYEFDNTMSRGPLALVGWLLLISVIMVLLVSLFVFVSGQGPTEDGQPLGFGQLLWYSLMREMDAGAVAGDTGSTFFVAAMFVLTLGGIFVLSTLIGVLTSGIESRLEELRKGRSFVVERDHTVILGWSPQVFSVISELMIANENRPRACIVILADKDKVEMEDEIRTRISGGRRMRVVCRTGNPLDLADLEIVNPDEARSIIILSPETDNPDTHVIKSILALTNRPNRRQAPYHIVADIHDVQNMEAARLVARNEAQLLLVGDLIARITVQTCRQSGLSVIYQELLDFGGDEIYFREEPQLVGKTFGEALMAYETSAVIGLATADGRAQLLPPMDRVIAAGDKIIAVSADDDTILLSGKSDYGINPTAIQKAPLTTPAPERTLILGWNERAPTILRELDNYVAPGSSAVVVMPEEREEAVALLNETITNQTVDLRVGNTTDRRTLNQLMATEYDHIIVLSNSDQLDPQEADARTLITLLHLRDIANQTGSHCSVVSEMLDVRNRDLAEVTRADDFIVSDKLISLMLAQVSENKALAAVFADLFDPEGAELYLKPIGDYILLGQPVNFYTVVEAARQRGEIAVGYRLMAAAGDETQAYGIRLNPHKAESVVFGTDDKIVVLAAD